jgi:hypothetical protein
VELIPARIASQAPTIRTLTYPVSIRVTRSEPADPPLAAGSAPPDGHDGNGNGPGDHETRRAPPRRRGRKRRRSDNTTAPPAGRADGMAMDMPVWSTDRRGRRADGIAGIAGWADIRRPEQPPRARRAPRAAAGARGMAPWPGQSGARFPRRQAKSGYYFQQRKDTTAAPTPAISTGPAMGATIALGGEEDQGMSNGGSGMLLPHVSTNLKNKWSNRCEKYWPNP